MQFRNHTSLCEAVTHYFIQKKNHLADDGYTISNEHPQASRAEADMEKEEHNDMPEHIEGTRIVLGESIPDSHTQEQNDNTI